MRCMLLDFSDKFRKFAPSAMTARIVELRYVTGGFLILLLKSISTKTTVTRSVFVVDDVGAVYRSQLHLLP
jgi:hypothetical protein